MSTETILDRGQGKISVVILTFNSSASIERTLKSVKAITDDIHVVDSFSSDHTVGICQRFGCHVVQRAFSTYSDQRNWAIENLLLKYQWQLHLDADEELEVGLSSTIMKLRLEDTTYDAYIMGRKTVVFGKVLRFGGIAKTWHLRLFRRGMGACEDRRYDQHFVSSGRVKVLNGFFRDHQDMSLSEWTARHNRWSDMEVKEVLAASVSPSGARVDAKALGTPIERRRYGKSLYYRSPLFLRAMCYFFVRYVMLFGFLDGKPGLIYHFLQGFWFRFLVDAKIFEARLLHQNARAKHEGSREDG